jgi:hypothetical protein
MFREAERAWEYLRQSDVLQLPESGISKRFTVNQEETILEAQSLI